MALKTTQIYETDENSVPAAGLVFIADGIPGSFLTITVYP